MFNIKNLIILSLSGALAAFSTLTLTKFAPLGQLPAYLLTGFLAVIIMQIILNLRAGSSNESISNDNNAKTATADNRESGTVKWFDSNKGYGFITRSMGEDIFVHFRSIRGNGYRSLYEGQSVEFIVTQGDKGPQAEDIHIIK